jgi:hypothetical protein
MSELIPVANTDDTVRMGDVIFVHGLGWISREYGLADKGDPERSYDSNVATSH